KSGISQIEFFMAEPLAISELREDFNFTVFPNPSKDFLKFETAASFNGSVKISDISGRTLSEKKLSGAKHELDIRSLIPGNYFITVTQNGRIFSQQFIRK